MKMEKDKRLRVPKATAYNAGASTISHLSQLAMGKRKKKLAPYAAQLDLPGAVSQSKKKKQKKKGDARAFAAGGQTNNRSVGNGVPKKGSSRHVAAVGAKFKSRHKGLKPVPPQPVRKKGGQQAAKKAPPKKGPGIKLPSQRRILKEVPWMKASSASEEVVDLTQDDDKDIIDLTQTTRRRRETLPTDECDPDLLERFSQELRVFADYVRLTAKEKQAREVLLQQMEEVALHQFPDEAADLKLQVFGSVACPSVCTFCSDLDVALFGAVGPKRNKQTKPHTVARTEESDLAEPDSKKQLKLKWSRLLASIDDENSMSPDALQTTLAPTKAKSSDLLPVCGASEDDNPPLFVMDRKGVDPFDKEKATASASVITQETIAESETSYDELANKEESPEEGEKEEVSGSLDDSSDDDTADKLTEATLRFASSVLGESATTQPLSACSHNDTEGELAIDTNVNFFHRTHPEFEADSSSFSRRKVVDGLERYMRGIRRRLSCNKIQLISRARVPIIKLESKLGVEVDISIGGMNGADTSLYALKMSKKYESFASVVVALKIFMAQQGLDSPFLGGLGSYKLYVLVAHHMAKHLALGGRDDPAEILMSFFFRYGGPGGKLKKIHTGTRTFINKDDVVSCDDGGRADLSNVFLIQECRHLFAEAWKKLWGSLKKLGKRGDSGDADRSFLAEVIHASWLGEGRARNVVSAENFLAHSDKHLRRPSRGQSPRVGKKRGPTEDAIVSGYARPSKKRK